MLGRGRGGGWILTWVLGLVMGLVASQVSISGTAEATPRESPGGGAPTGQPDAEGQATQIPAEPVRSTPRSPAGALRFVATYDFDIVIDPKRRTASVDERLVVTNRTDSDVQELNLFVLPHLNRPGFLELVLNSLVVDGDRMEPAWTQDGANLLVRLSRELHTGSSTALALSFTLRPGPRVDGSMTSALSRTGDLMQFLLWYPMLSDGQGARLNGDGTSAMPASTITYHITSSSPVTMALPGTVIERTDGEARGRIDAARDVAFAVSPTFRVWAGRTSDGATVRVYAPPGTFGAAARDFAVEALERDATILGMPYPGSDLVIVGGTMDLESSGLVFVPQADLENEYAVGHEVAHQWFHWLVGNDQLREPWLDEALATYLAGGLRPRHEDGFCSNRPVNSPVDAFPSADPGASWQLCDGYVQTVY